MAKAREGQSVLGPYRVLDLTNEMGVFCTKVLAALGADVIKIEPPGGDATRRIGPFYHDEPDPEKSLHWFTYNLNKRSVTLNIECTTGQELFKRLVKTADFVVECFDPGHLDKLGLGYAELSSINPRIILTSITPWGQTGPYSQYKGSNLISSAASGYMYLCGDEDRPPVQITTPVADIETALVAASATMVAHWYRQRTGKGQHIDISGQEGINVARLPSPMFWKAFGAMPIRSSSGTISPKPGEQVHRRPMFFECKDGLAFCWLTVARGRRALREWLASEGMAEDLFDEKWEPFFLENTPTTPEQEDYIGGLFRAFAMKHTVGEIVFKAQEMGIEAVPVTDVRDLMEDPHLKERDYFIKIEHPELNDTIVYGGAPFKSSEMSWSYWRRAPFIGEHNQEIYDEELGISQQELGILKQGGVI